MNCNIDFYSSHADELVDQYDSVEFDEVHQEWLDELPESGMILDIGAGSGRDARYLAGKGFSVVAVEPAANLRRLAQAKSISYPIHWLDDSLPELGQVFQLQTKFDLIIVSAVWMHIAPSQRKRGFRKLSSLLKPGGKLIISLRHGEFTDGRSQYPVSASELANFANQFGLSYTLLTSDKRNDVLGRAEVEWQTVLLILPDDGTGAFPLIRNIVLNDSKAATYKVALLRTLLRIAEGHPGAVMEQTDEHVILPMGLVSLYWMKLYKPLLDLNDMQQSGNTSKGLGFVKDNGWEQLRHYANNDFYLGAHYRDPKLHHSLYRTLKDISSTIKNMPANYITMPGTQNQIFHVELSRTTKPKSELCLDFQFLSSLGKFYVPNHIWDALSRFSVWIEPALVSEWMNLMAGYEINRQKNFSKLDYMNALNWDDPERTTVRVRKRVADLLESEDVLCCWSGKSIKSRDYAIDHAFPFARWPNNDLWNLLPSKSSINLAKSDKLPTRTRLDESRDYILYWWRQAWMENKSEFFTQANFTLPNLHQCNDNYEDVFEAFTLQRDRILDTQQLQLWK